MSLPAAMQPCGDELLARYRSNYRLPEECLVTETMVLRHWNLERSLRQTLLDATPAQRWTTFQDSYTALYGELSWLNATPAGATAADEVTFKRWEALLGPPPRRVYEVGSGKGELIQYLARRGYQCRGSEITAERGQRWTDAQAGLTWGLTDGVHLARFEPPGSYDAVISDQVIEHLHPDDVLDHLRGAHALLADGGRYLFSTPHAAWGPSDVSRVFRHPQPVGMHLKEYTYRELADLARQAGFARVASVVRLPRRMASVLGGRVGPRASHIYLSYLRMIERAFAVGSARRRPGRLARLALFPTDIMLVAERGATAVGE